MTTSHWKWAAKCCLSRMCRKQGQWAIIYSKVLALMLERKGENMKLVCVFSTGVLRRETSIGIWFNLEDSTWVVYGWFVVVRCMVNLWMGWIDQKTSWAWWFELVSTVEVVSVAELPRLLWCIIFCCRWCLLEIWRWVTISFNVDLVCKTPDIIDEWWLRVIPYLTDWCKDIYTIEIMNW